MCNLDLDVAIAGGITYHILPLLSGLPIYGIVIGRGITAQPDPAQAAEKIARRIREIWPA
jgi:3-dehydro-L-gulonate-6-phosphate decarboxylase